MIVSAAASIMPQTRRVPSRSPGGAAPSLAVGGRAPPGAVDATHRGVRQVETDAESGVVRIVLRCGVEQELLAEDTVPRIQPVPSPMLRVGLTGVDVVIQRLVEEQL